MPTATDHLFRRTVLAAATLGVALLALIVTIVPTGATPPKQAADADSAVEVRDSQWLALRTSTERRPSLSEIEPIDQDERWLTDVAAARTLARETNRPMFVTMRCLPCDQCSDFDADVLDGGRELGPLLDRFVTVRVTDMAEIDLNWFRAFDYQDFDISWWGYIITPDDGRILAIFGGKDHIGDSTRISERALINVLHRTLMVWTDPMRNRILRNNVIGAPAPTGERMTPFDVPGYESWQADRRGEMDPEAEGSCFHCHQIIEVQRQPAIDAGEFDPATELDMWPLPENVGITLNRDHGLRVDAVEDGSAADDAGVKRGDILVAADGRFLFGQADFRGVLHRGPQEDGSIALVWARPGDGGREVIHRASLAVETGWRETVIWWRQSVSGGAFGAGPTFFPLPANNNDRRRYGVGADTMAVKPWHGRGPQARERISAQAGLRQNHHLITAINGESPNIAGRELLTWFRLRHNPGDEITLTVRDPQRRESEITYTLPANEE